MSSSPTQAGLSGADEQQQANYEQNSHQQQLQGRGSGEQVQGKSASPPATPPNRPTTRVVQDQSSSGHGATSSPGQQETASSSASGAASSSGTRPKRDKGAAPGNDSDLGPRYVCYLQNIHKKYNAGTMLNLLLANHTILEDAEFHRLSWEAVRGQPEFFPSPDDMDEEKQKELAENWERDLVARLRNVDARRKGRALQDQRSQVRRGSGLVHEQTPEDSADLVYTSVLCDSFYLVPENLNNYVAGAWLVDGGPGMSVHKQQQPYIPHTLLSQNLHPLVRRVLSFFTLPLSKFATKNLGYCFMCFRTPELCTRFGQLMHGKRMRWASTKTLQVHDAQMRTLEALKKYFHETDANDDAQKEYHGTNVFWFNDGEEATLRMLHRNNAAWRDLVRERTNIFHHQPGSGNGYRNRGYSWRSAGNNDGSYGPPGVRERDNYRTFGGTGHRSGGYAGFGATYNNRGTDHYRSAGPGSGGDLNFGGFGPGGDADSDLDWDDLDEDEDLQRPPRNNRNPHRGGGGWGGNAGGPSSSSRGPDHVGQPASVGKEATGGKNSKFRNPLDYNRNRQHAGGGGGAPPRGARRRVEQRGSEEVNWRREPRGPQGEQYDQMWNQYEYRGATGAATGRGPGASSSSGSYTYNNNVERGGYATGKSHPHRANKFRGGSAPVVTSGNNPPPGAGPADPEQSSSSSRGGYDHGRYVNEYQPNQYSASPMHPSPSYGGSSWRDREQQQGIASEQEQNSGGKQRFNRNNYGGGVPPPAGSSQQYDPSRYNDSGGARQPPHYLPHPSTQHFSSTQQGAGGDGDNPWKGVRPYVEQGGGPIVIDPEGDGRGQQLQYGGRSPRGDKGSSSSASPISSRHHQQWQQRSKHNKSGTTTASASMMSKTKNKPGGALAPQAPSALQQDQAFGTSAAVGGGSSSTTVAGGAGGPPSGVNAARGNPPGKFGNRGAPQPPPAGGPPGGGGGRGYSHQDADQMQNFPSTSNQYAANNRATPSFSDQQLMEHLLQSERTSQPGNQQGANLLSVFPSDGEELRDTFARFLHLLGGQQVEALLQNVGNKHPHGASGGGGIAEQGAALTTSSGGGGGATGGMLLTATSATPAQMTSTGAPVSPASPLDNSSSATSSHVGGPSSAGGGYVETTTSAADAAFSDEQRRERIGQLLAHLGPDVDRLAGALVQALQNTGLPAGPLAGEGRGAGVGAGMALPMQLAGAGADHGAALGLQLQLGQQSTAGGIYQNQHLVTSAGNSGNVVTPAQYEQLEAELRRQVRSQAPMAVQSRQQQQQQHSGRQPSSAPAEQSDYNPRSRGSGLHLQLQASHQQEQDHEQHQNQRQNQQQNQQQNQHQQHQRHH